ncbi:hypothetical protein FBUS_01512 [Fasciolopsis buskii]|uniref:Uncharacterized protein n=1 Tax=Fasciolopsis buskii TaxID=27845 RepID=A0A8E0VG75_9TREM|nr:hypothetical protein FBUS_01512 [Fasciolopsis buski]
MKYLLFITVMGVGLSLLATGAMITCPQYHTCYEDYTACSNTCRDDYYCRQRCSEENADCLRNCMFDMPSPYGMWRGRIEPEDLDQQDPY